MLVGIVFVTVKRAQVITTEELKNVPLSRHLERYSVPVAVHAHGVYRYFQTNVHAKRGQIVANDSDRHIIFSDANPTPLRAKVLPVESSQSRVRQRVR